MEKSANIKMTAKTMFGLEEVLAAELLALGARDIVKLNRAVAFTGDKGFMYKANLCLRTALRILVPINTFTVTSEQSLYDEIKKMEWENYLDVSGTLAVDASLNTDLFKHSQFISQKTKDAVVDRFREKFSKRPSVDLNQPSLRINIHVYKNQCTVSLDSSGESLHKRGYRDQTNLAPLNEVLAAGMVLLSGWNKLTTFIDPMCGSGTIAIEAALYSANIPPGYFKKEFGFERWSRELGIDKELYQTIRDSVMNKISEHLPTVTQGKVLRQAGQPKIIASDVSPNVSKKAKQNIRSAKVNDLVAVTTSSFEELTKPEGKSVIIMNPPYGERMDKDDIIKLYKTIGSTMKRNWSGCTCWLISSNTEAIHAIGLRPSRKITLYNGSLECKFMKFEMYEGTKKIHKVIGNG